MEKLIAVRIRIQRIITIRNIGMIAFFYVISVYLIDGLVFQPIRINQGTIDPIWYMIGITPSGIILGVFGPIAVGISLVTYLVRISHISKLPTSSSLYEAIVKPTILYGPIKVLLPVFEYENEKIEN